MKPMFSKWRRTVAASACFVPRLAALVLPLSLVSPTRRSVTRLCCQRLAVSIRRTSRAPRRLVIPIAPEASVDRCSSTGSPVNNGTHFIVCKGECVYIPGELFVSACATVTECFGHTVSTPPPESHHRTGRVEHSQRQRPRYNVSKSPLWTGGAMCDLWAWRIVQSSPTSALTRDHAQLIFAS